MIKNIFENFHKYFGSKANSNRAFYSVVLGSFNRSRFLKFAIESVRNNSNFSKYEIIVVDGGSTDGSLEWLVEQKDIITIVQHNHGELLGKNIEKRSWGYFMNLGFKIAQGKYILMISDDCILLPNAINKGIEIFERLLDDQKKIAGVAFYFRNWPSENDYYVQKTLGGKLMVNHGLFLREALESVGWVDEDHYVFYKADGDLSLRLWRAGYQIVDAPGAFVEHYLDPSEQIRINNNVTLELDKKNYAERWNDLVLISKNNNDMGKIKLSYDDPEKTADQKFGSRKD